MAERKGLRKIGLGKDLLCQAVGKAAAVVRQHDSAGGAREHLPDGVHVGIGFSARAAEVLLVYQVAVTGYEQAAVLAGGLSVLEGRIEAARVDAGMLADFCRIIESSPAAARIRRGKVASLPAATRAASLSKGTAMGRDKSVLRVSAMTGILDGGWKGILPGVLLPGGLELPRAHLLFAVPHHASDV